jgi:replicative DNA helicase
LNEKLIVKRNKALYRDILSILDFHEKKDKLDIPITIKNKFDCLKKVCTMKLNDKSNESVVDSIQGTEKYLPLVDFISFKANEEPGDDTVDYVRQVRLRKKLNSLFSNYDELSKFLESLKDGSFDSIDDLVLDYEEIIKTLYTNMMEENRGTAIEASSSLDLVKDDFVPVIELIKKKYERVNAIPTGFSIFDNEILRGGLESSRLYIFGGSSGSGKSTLINNIMINGATNNITTIDSKIQVTKKNEISKVFVSITLENTIEESLLRCYQSLYNKDAVQTLSNITNGVDIKQSFVDKMKYCGSTIVMKYFPAYSISYLDIMSVLDDVIVEYGKDSIQALFVDYLDLLRTDVKYDLYRLELGHITMSLKNLAVQYNIPVVVPTQLGRSAYRIQDSSNLYLDQISEAIKKVEHGDFVALMCKDPTNDSLVHMKVGKNRSGKSDISVDWNVNFDHYKFNKGVKISNVNKPDDTTHNKKNVDDFEGTGKL